MLNKTYPFTRESQLAIDQARQHAEKNQQSDVNSLMILLALLRLKNSRMQAVLRSLNVKVENLAARIEATIKLETETPMPNSKAKPVDLTAESETVLNASFGEMQQSGQAIMDEYSLLLGMLQSPESKAGQILMQYAVTAEQVREQMKIIKNTPATRSSVLNRSSFFRKALRHGISPIFISLVLFTILMAAFLWLGIGNNPRAFLIAFIMGGWIVSVALHEFGHAITAFWGGDESVEDKGYLTLNPLKYSNPVLSIIIPVVMLLLGGIGFPGGAVYINVHALRKPAYRSLVSAAGPLANLFVVFLLALPFDNIPFMLFFGYAPEIFLMAIAFLAFLQITAILINLLPIPGLDGFGILEPYLPQEFVGVAGFIRPFGFFILYFFVFVDSPISEMFWTSVWNITDFFVPNLAYYANEGLKLFLNL